MIYIELLPWGQLKSPFTGEILWDKGLLHPDHLDAYWVNWETHPVFTQPYIWKLLQESQPKNLKDFLFQTLADLPHRAILTTSDPDQNLHILLIRDITKI